MASPTSTTLTSRIDETAAPRARAATRIAALVGLAAGLSLTAGPALAQPPVGFLSAVDGTVQIQPVASSDWQLAAVDNEISLGDAILTGPDSAAQILLIDDTTLTLAADTEMVIDRMIVGDLATQERSILRQIRGQVRANVGQAFGGTTRLEVHTPTAVAGVRGSTMQILVRRDTLACNEEGEMFVRNIDDRIGTEIDIPVGTCSRVYEGARPEPPEVYPDFPRIQAFGRTRVAARAIEALVATNAGVGADDGSAEAQSKLPGTRSGPRDAAGTEPAFDGGPESLRGLAGLLPESPPTPATPPTLPPLLPPGDPR